jgi:hypothetical protein
MAVALLISDDGHVTNIGTRSWRRQRLAALAAGGFLFAFGLHLGFYVAREPSIYKSRPWGPSNTHVGSQSSPAILPSHDEPSSPDLHTNSSFQPSGSNPVNGACLAYPFPDLDVVIVVKTGATEALNRIPTQLLTFLSFAKDDVSIFSDMVQKIGKSHVYDAIVDVVDEARIVNSDFELYEMQKQVKMFGEDISSLSKGEEA